MSNQFAVQHLNLIFTECASWSGWLVDALWPCHKKYILSLDLLG